MKTLIASLKKFCIRHFTPSKWETVYAARCSTRAIWMFEDYGRVSAVVKIQVERRKNLARGIIEAMGDASTCSLAEIVLGNLEAQRVCARENISI
jgi:hypothetical protein